MTIEIQTTGSADKSNPIVARLGSQTVHLIQWLDLREGKRAAVQHLYLNTLMPRLLRGATFRNALVNELIRHNKAAPSRLIKYRDIRYLPQIEGLQGMVEGFLCESTTFLLDLLELLQIVYDCELKNLTAFAYSNGGNVSNIVQWAARAIGTDDDLTKILRSNQGWTAKLIRMSNAIEFPNGKSGTLTVQNVRVRTGQLDLIPPAWQLTNALESAILTDMDRYIDKLLTLAEDVLLAPIRRTAIFKNVGFDEVPLDQRNTECPVRIRFVLRTDAP